MGKFLFFVTMLCIVTSLTVFSEPLNKDSISKILADKNIDPFERYKNAANTIHRSDISSEQALDLHQTVMMSFCEKEIEYPEHRNRAFANTYDCIRMYNNRLGNSAGVLAAIEAAVPYLEQCQDARTKADFYRGFGTDA